MGFRAFLQNIELSATFKTLFPNAFIQGGHFPEPKNASKEAFLYGPDNRRSYSTVTLLARLRGWSTSVPLSTAT